MIGRLEGQKIVVPEITSSDKVLLRTVQVQMKIFIKISLFATDSFNSVRL